MSKGERTGYMKGGAWGDYCNTPDGRVGQPKTHLGGVQGLKGSKFHKKGELGKSNATPMGMGDAMGKSPSDAAGIRLGKK